MFISKTRQLILNKKNPLAILLASILISIIFRFHITYLNFIGLMLESYIIFYGIKNPWLLLIALIPSFFSIEPVPQSMGYGEVMIFIMLLFFTISTFYYELKNKNYNEIRYILSASLIFFTIIFLSFVWAFNQHVIFSSWFRAIAPFLIWYLTVPIYYVLREDFSYKTKWVLIACSALAVLVVCDTNGTFLFYSLYKLYWLDENNHKLYSLDNLNKLKQISGPYRDRVTVYFSQSTSELLPLSFVIFSLMSIFNYKLKYIRFSLLFFSILALFAILETYTRSMLISSLLAITMILIILFYTHVDYAKKYIKVVSILFSLGLCFVYSLNIESFWLGRLSMLTQIFTHNFNLQHNSNLQHNFNLQHNSNLQHTEIDENIKTRYEEFLIAINFFKKNPLFGAGLGIKHDMKFQVSGDNYIYQSVGYIHNWFLYWLMVGGGSGLFIYISIVTFPFIVAIKYKNVSFPLRIITGATIFTMLLYGLFFAVYRLLIFNFLIAILCGISLYIVRDINHLEFKS